MGKGSILIVLTGLFALPFLITDCGGGGGGGAPQSHSSTKDGGIGGGDGPGWDDYGDTQFEVCRGPFGGDRTTVVVHPRIASHVITNSCDKSGIWMSDSSGKFWRRCNPSGAPFARHNTLVALMPEQGVEPDEVLVAITTEHDTGTSFYKVPLDDPGGSPAVALPGVKSRVRCMAVDPSPARPGRIAAAAFSVAHLGEMGEGNIVYSPDRGQTWRRWFAGGRFHSVLSMSFTHDGNRLLIGSAGSIAPEELRRLYEDEGTLGIMTLIYQFEHGLSVDPSWVSEYGIDETPCVLAVDPLDGTTAAPGAIMAGHRVEAMALNPRIGGVVWFGHADGVERSTDDAQSVESLDLMVETMRIPFPKPIKPQGITILRNPDTDAETAFVALGGGWSRTRGLFRLEYSRVDTTWFIERVSPEADWEFLDYPAAAVVAAPSHERLMYAPYCADGMLVSHEFGSEGSWEISNEGLTGFNVFRVSEDPSEPSRIFCTGQNVIRYSTNRVADCIWNSVQVQIDQATANLRAGVTVDPGNADRWFVGGGAGSSGNLNGGIWLTEDGGENWTRVLGSNSTPETNPQVYTLIQHPDDPNLVAAASSRWMASGEAGVWASASRGEAESFTRLLDDGDYTSAVPIICDGTPSVLVGGKAGMALVSIEGGNPKAVKLPWEHAAVTALGACSQYAFAGTVEGDLYRVRLEYLTDEPLWTRLMGIGSEITALACSPHRTGELYMGLIDNGILHSSDSGATFFTFDTGLESSERRIFHLMISALGDRLYAGTLGGLAVRKLD